MLETQIGTNSLLGVFQNASFVSSSKGYYLSLWAVYDPDGVYTVTTQEVVSSLKESPEAGM